MGELLDRIGDSTADEEYRVGLCVHGHWLFAGGVFRDSRVTRGGPWADRLRSWAAEFDGPTVGITTLRHLDEDPNATKRPASDVLYGHDEYDLIFEDAKKGDQDGGTLRTILASAVLADGEGTPDPVPAWIDDTPGADAPVADVIPPVGPGTDPSDLDPEDLDPDRVYARYVDVLERDVDDLSPAVLRYLDPEYLTAAYDQTLRTALETAGADESGRLTEYRNEWDDTVDRFEDAYEEFVDALVGRIDVVELSGGTYTKCQSQIVDAILEGTDDLVVEVDPDATFTIDMNREHPATQRGLDPEPLDDRDVAEELLAGAPPSLEEAPREGQYPVTIESIESQTGAYLWESRVGFTDGMGLGPVSEIETSADEAVGSGVDR